VVNVFLSLMYCLEKSEVSVLLAKLDVPNYQIGLFGFGRQNICFFCFNFCKPLVMCITFYFFTHTFVSPLRCIDIGGGILDFLEKSVK
jgi:hypothetical protein